jgi:murein DD-endopeptidase MepM/ murein hydrolase activator NlpD
MIARRALLATGAAFALLPRAAADVPRQDADPRISLRGSREQGGLLIGKVAPNVAVEIDGQPVHVTSQGLFVLGLAWDGEKPIRVHAAFADASDYEEIVQPVKRQYDIQSITGLPQEYVEPPPDILERMKREREAIWTARLADSEGVGFFEPLEWPCAGRLSGVYGSQRILNGKPMAPHLAVDVAAPEGTPIHAAADGVVMIADDYYLEGGFTLIDHGHGVNTCYLHQSARFVKAGDAVQQGDVIGHIGKTGRATGPHCHWGLCWFQMKLDPSRATKMPMPPSV